jgi:hypothetical protein
MSDAKIQETPTLAPQQSFEGHTDSVSGVIHLPEGQRIINCNKGPFAATMEHGERVADRGRLAGQRQPSACHCVISGREKSGKRKWGRCSDVVGHQHREDDQMGGAYRCSEICLLDW